jgi:ABC-type amino acid transport system permease subunit
MNTFEGLLLGHVVGDFLLQTRWMAAHKAAQWLPLAVHAAVYTVSVAVLGSLVGTLHLWALAVLFVSHMALDHRRFVRWWSRVVQGVTPGAPEAWVIIMADQSFHLLVMGLVAYWR